MINNRAHFQFRAYQHANSIVIECYHSSNQIKIGASSLSCLINFGKFQDSRNEIYNWDTLQRYLSNFPNHRKVTFEILLHMFLTK
jgi:hypothetical protein